MNDITRQWVLREGDESAWTELSRELDIHPLTARILLQRGVRAPDEAYDFLNPALKQMHDPFSMKGMDRAVREILLAIEGGRSIVIHGDYDVDGVCSVSILHSFLSQLGADVAYFIPRREQEGYGLSAETVERLHAEGAGMLITTDCGISNVDEIKLARDLGMRTIVVDHHTVPPELPPAEAILNPLQEGCRFPFKKLAAVGVTFNLVVALRKELRERGVFGHVPEPDLRNLLDLVALGTVADVVPLVDENRIFVRYGLEVLKERKRAGVSALLERVGKNESVDTQTVSFGLAPRLNAAGRMGDASICVELLTTRDYGRALKLANRLEELNAARQEKEREILESALPQAEKQVEDLCKILVVSGKDWHRGVLGIVASRLMERFHRPAILAGVEEGQARGSARSIDGIDLIEILTESSELLDTYGGHTLAAGLSFQADDIDALRERLNEAVDEMLSREALPNPKLSIDGVVKLGELDERFVRDLDRLEPFGTGNRQPILMSPNAKAQRPRIVGEDHLRARFRDDSGAMEAIGFSMKSMMDLLDDDVAIAFVPRYTTFRGRGRLELHLKDIRPASSEPPDRVE